MATTISLPLALAIALAPIGVLASWLVHRHTHLSARNLYLLALLALAATAGALVARGPDAVKIALPVIAPAIAAAAAARRYRAVALGAGGELRQYELSRLMIWSALRARERRERRRKRARGDRTYVGPQGELRTIRGWPPEVEALPMSANGCGRLPRGEGRHLLFVGMTGTGKTTSGLRWAATRVLGDRTALLVVDPKGDRVVADYLRRLSAFSGRPLVVFDALSETSDRWNVLWSRAPGMNAERLMAPLTFSEVYYRDVLRNQLSGVLHALQAVGAWPPTMPLVIEAVQPQSVGRLVALLERAEAGRALADMRQQAAMVEQAQRDVATAANRLRVVVGHAWRHVLEPDPQRGAIALPDALEAGAIVLWRTWGDELREEAQGITSLILADVISAASELEGRVEWSLMLDEFGAVLRGEAGEYALAMLERARAGGGQAALLTQSVADVAAATGNDALLQALGDNFTGYAIHNQASPESRDWLAKLPSKIGRAHV